MARRRKQRKQPRYLIHVTNPGYVKSILEHGLIPCGNRPVEERPKFARNWLCEIPYWPAGRFNSGGYRTARLLVDVQDIVLDVDDSPYFPYVYWTSETIAPDRIEVITWGDIEASGIQAAFKDSKFYVSFGWWMPGPPR